jgi:hypothetical protein
MQHTLPETRDWLNGFWATKAERSSRKNSIRRLP